MFDIKGKNCIVTGSATGIGLCYVKELLKNGANKVCMFDIDEKRGEEACKQLITEMGRDCCCFKKVDVTNEKEFEEAFKSCVNSMKTLDIVINNAGILNDGKWQMEVAINVNAVIRGTLLAYQYMGRDNGGKGGVIVNIASILGLQPLAGCPVYVGTKHAVIGMSRSWGMPFYYNRTGVKVLTMCPGVTDTPLISEAQGHQIDPTIGRECERELASLPKQVPEHVGKEMMKLITKGESGSVWVCEGGEPIYEVEIPDRLTLPRKH